MTKKIVFMVVMLFAVLAFLNVAGVVRADEAALDFNNAVNDATGETLILQSEGNYNITSTVNIAKNIIINDCYNASYETMISGLTYFNNEKYHNKIVILGDILELGHKSNKIHKEIAKYIIKNKLESNTRLKSPPAKILYTAKNIKPPIIDIPAR